MPVALEFFQADPKDVAGRLDGQTIHLWRLRYAMPLGRAPFLALLAAYLDLPVSSVLLDQDARGKPRLVQEAVAPASGLLEFNWSHSGDLALLAVARGCALGVDIERFGKKPRSLEIARRFFDGSEADALEPLDPEARDRAFISLWCAKEAVLKAVGEGLSFGLARLAFTRRGDADWSLARVDPALGDAKDWRLAGFDVASGYRGALAWRGSPRTILAFQATESAG